MRHKTFLQPAPLSNMLRNIQLNGTASCFSNGRSMFQGLRGLSLMALLPVMALLLCLAPTAGATAGKPSVTVLSLDTSDAGDFSYAGPAVRQMLISRLASEKLRIILPDAAKKSPVQDKKNRQGLDADYIVAGKIIAGTGNKIIVHLELKTPISDTPVAQWDIKPGSISGLIPETGRYSIDIAQAINDQADHKAIFTDFSGISDNVEKNDKPLIKNKELKLARMHPDRLYRETPVSRKGTAPTDRIRDGINEEKNNQEKETTDNKKNGLTPDVEETETGRTDNDQWQPDYPPEYHDEPLVKTKKNGRMEKPEHDGGSTVHGTAEMEHQQKIEGNTSPKKQTEWYSHLWSFRSEEKPRGMPAPVPADKLPYPVPHDLNHPPAEEGRTISLTALRSTGSTIYDRGATPAAQGVKSDNPASVAGPVNETAEANDEETINISDEIINSHAETAKAQQKAAPMAEEAPLTTGISADSTPDNGTVDEDTIDMQAGMADSEESSPDTGKNTNYASLSPDLQGNDQEVSITAPSPLPVTQSASKVSPQHAETAAGIRHAPTTSTTNAMHPPFVNRSTSGWFSWLWPDSWKGGADEPVRHTALAKPAIRQEEQAINNREPNSDTYHSAAEPAPVKGKKAGPVWVWN